MISSMGKIAGLWCLVAVLYLSQAAPFAQSGMLFTNGWDQNVGTGCDFTKITDRSAWNDYGPGSTCDGSTHDADIDNTQSVDGSQSLRVNFTPDGSQNGPDFRIVKRLGTNHQQLYARWYTKWSNNWVFASGDHKVAIFGNAAETTQDIYFNIRGNGNGPSGRVVIGITPSDTVFSDRNVSITPGVWHLFEIRIVSGSNGRIEAKADGRLLNLTYEAGNQANITSLNTGGGTGYIKLDTTYNIYSYPSSLGLFMNTWYDAVALSTSGWVGGISGGGSGGGTTAPTPPSNLRIISS